MNQSLTVQQFPFHHIKQISVLNPDPFCLQEHKNINYKALFSLLMFRLNILNYKDTDPYTHAHIYKRSVCKKKKKPFIFHAN